MVGEAAGAARRRGTGPAVPFVRGAGRRRPGGGERLRAAAEERWARFGSASQRLEPDVKEGAGGLRDIHTLGWLAPAVPGDGGIRGLESAGLLRAAERQSLDAAEEYLVRVRSALH